MDLIAGMTMIVRAFTACSQLELSATSPVQRPFKRLAWESVPSMTGLGVQLKTAVSVNGARNASVVSARLENQQILAAMVLTRDTSLRIKSMVLVLKCLVSKKTFQMVLSVIIAINVLQVAVRVKSTVIGMIVTIKLFAYLQDS